MAGKQYLNIQQLDILAPLGVYDDILTVNKFGLNIDLDTGDVPEEIWTGGDAYQWPVAAQFIDVVSTSEFDHDDGLFGTGAFKVTIQGLDSDWNLLSEEIDLLGLTTVTTTNKFLRVFRAFVSASGNTTFNIGRITMTSQNESSLVAAIEAGVGQTEMAIYTVPLGYVALMRNWWASLNKPGAAAGLMVQVALSSRTNDNSGDHPIVRRKESGALAVDGSAFFQRDFFPAKKFNAKDDIFCQAINTTANSANISAGFDLVLIKESMVTGWDKWIK